MNKQMFSDLQGIYDKAIELLSTDAKHKHYDHVVKLSEYWQKMVYGKNHDDFILTYRPSETQPQKKQRLRVYKNRTAYLLNRIKSKIKKADRVDFLIDEISYPNDSENNKETDLRARIGPKFNGGKSLKQYLNDRYYNLNEIDPNAFIGINFFDFDNTQEKPYVYPVELRSDVVLNWSYTNRVLDYIWFYTTTYVKVEGKKEKQPCKRYHLAAQQYTLVFEEIIDKQENSQNENRLVVNIDTKGKLIKSYHYEEYNHGSNQVPFSRVGYIPDNETNGETYESIYAPTKDILEDICIKKSELDTILLTHGVMQKFAYVPACEHTDDHGNQCQAGTITCFEDQDNILDDFSEVKEIKKKCPKCKGTGKKQYHQSSQDIITLEIDFGSNSQPEDFIELDKLIHYEHIPQELIVMYREMLKELESDVSKAMFDINLFNKDGNESKTPEAIRSQNEALSNVLFEYCSNKSNFYHFAVLQTAIYMDQYEGLIASFKPPTDYKLDTVDDLINQYASAENMPVNVRDKILKQIYFKQNQDNPEQLDKIMAREKFKPFKHMTEAERMIAIDMLPQDANERTLWLYFDQIMTEIENSETLTYTISDSQQNTNIPFHQIANYFIQKSIVDNVTQKYKPENSILLPREVADNTSLEIDYENNARTFSNGSREGNTLAQSVGGSQIVGRINEEVATGKLSREGGINRAMIQLGYDRDTAELLVPEPVTSTPNPDLV